MIKRGAGRIRKTVLSVVLALAMVLGSLALTPQTAYAVNLDSSKITVGNIQQYESGSVKSVDVKFYWPSSKCDVYVVLLNKGIGNGNNAMVGTYGKFWNGYEESLQGIEEKTGCKVVSYSPEDEKVTAELNEYATGTFNFSDGTLPIGTDATYYAYLWTTYQGYTYPDAFLSKVIIKNGTISSSSNYDHDHSWEYSASDNVITVKCSNDDGHGANCDYLNGRTLTVSAENATYTGEAYSGYSSDDKISDVIKSDIQVTYVGRDNTGYPESATAPTLPGDYTVKVTTGGVTATKDFSINKKSLENVTVSLDGWTLGGDDTTIPTPAVSGVDDGSNITYYVKAKDANDSTYEVKTVAEIQALPAGSYTIYAKVAASATTDEAQTRPVDFTVNKKDLVPTVSLGDWTKGDSASTPNVEGVDSDSELTFYVKAKGADDSTYENKTVAEIQALPVGSYTIYAKVAESETANGATSEPVDFTVSKKTITPMVEIDGWIRGDAASTPDVKNADDDAKITYYIKGADDTDYHVIDADEIKDLPAGDYTIYAKIAESETTNEATSAPVNFTVSKKTITPAVKIDGWTYGDEANDPSLGENSNPGDGDVTYTYYADEACTQALNGVPTDAGTYYVKATIEVTDDYEGGTSVAVPFTIAKRKVKATISASDRTYDGSTDVDISAAIDSKDLVAGDSIKISGLTGGVKDGDAGKDKAVAVDKSDVQISGKGSENYEIEYDIDGGNNGDDATGKALTITVAPKIVSLNWKNTNGSKDPTLYYNGKEQGVEATVVGADDDAEFKITYVAGKSGKATDAGDYIAEVADLGNPNYALDENSSASIDWSIKNITADDAAIGGTRGNNDWYIGNVTLTPPEGYEIAVIDAADDNNWSGSMSYDEDGEQTVTYYLRDKATGYITAAKTMTFKIDHSAPEGEIETGDNRFKTFLNTITFDHYFKDHVKVVISGTDKVSGIASIEYQKVGAVDAYDENGTWTVLDLKDGKGSFDILADDKTVIYARITDNAGNVTIINSDGLVIYKEAAEESSDNGSSHKAHDGGYGSVIVYNVDGESGKLLAGAAYALYKSNDEYVGTYTVGADGRIALGNIPASTYYLKQIKAADGYAMDYNVIRFIVADDQDLAIKLSSQTIAAAYAGANNATTGANAGVNSSVATAETATDGAATAGNGAQDGAQSSVNAGIYTGDESNMVLYGAAAGAAAILLAVWFVMNRRRANG